jgi:16S rRNA processing protein RimM
VTEAGPEYVLVGRIRKAHGIRGEVVIEPFTDEPAAVFAAGRRVFVGTADGELAPGAPVLHIERVRPPGGSGGWIVKAAGIETRNDAERWRDRWLLLPRTELPEPEEGEVYLDDLVGLEVIEQGAEGKGEGEGDDATSGAGRPLGTVGEVYELPQGIILDVVRDGRTVVCLPFSDDVVKELDVEAKRVVVVVPPGLLD